MKNFPRFNHYLRKLARYVGPLSAGATLRGCPCPNPVDVPDKPFTQSIAADGQLVVDNTPESWAAFCEAVCPNLPLESCRIRVNTSDANSLKVAEACTNDYGGRALSGEPSVWVSYCKSTCGEEQDCLIGPVEAKGNVPITNCESWWLNCGGGRRTEGVDAGCADGEDRVGWILAQMAGHEAQSVPAFARLRAELRAHGAPRGLRRRASRGRRDELQHAHALGSLARRHGATLPEVDMKRTKWPSARPLEEIALENAVEGCVRETFGAYVAWQQSERAKSPELRGVMRRIAADEARHAALAWEIHRWALRRLDKAAHERIQAAMMETWREIEASMHTGDDPAAKLLGMPSA